MAGIQSLTVTLFVTLVIVTGVLIGTLSITSGNKATDDAEEAGDKGVSDCIWSSQQNIEEVTDALLDSILSQFRTKLLGILKAPEVATMEVADFISARHPDIATNPEFIDNTVRPILSAKQRATYALGITQIGVFSHGFSPNSETLKKLYPGGGWGGDLVLTVADESVSLDLPKDRPIWTNMESRSPDFKHFQANPIIYTWGNHDRRGYLIDAPCIFLPNYTAGEVTGPCPVPYKSFATDTFVETKSRGLGDRDVGEVFEINKPTWSPQFSSGPYLSMTVSVPYTHPEMVNKFAMQNHRMGVVMVGVTTSDISEMIKQFALPTGSYLYAVEHNSWTQEAKYLTGSSYGTTLRRTRVSFLGKTWPKVDPILVTNHSTVNINDVNDTSVPSVVARHGSFVLESGGYNVARIRSESEKVVSWTASLMPNETTPQDLNGTGLGVLYWTQVQMAETNGLRWYFSLLVPREVMMAKIDEAERQIKVDLSLNKNRATEDKRRDFTLMMVIVAISVTLLLIGGYFLTKVIITPLRLLELEMAEIALMKLDSVDADRELSKLSEVAAMQVSFKRMVANLKQYREYMPQSVLVDTEDDSETELESKVEISIRHSNSSASTTTATATSHSRASGAARNISDTHIRRRCVSVVLFNISNFHGIVRGGGETNVDVPFSEVLGAVLLGITQAVAVGKGICDTFLGDRVLASFNAVIPSSGHRASCSKTGIAAVLACQQSMPKVRVSFACTSGDTRVGNMGVAGMKKFTIIGPLVPFAAVLERVNLRIPESMGVCDKWINEDANQFIDARLVKFVSYPKRSASDVPIYQILGYKKVQEEEWMYQLASARSWGDWEQAINAAYDSNWDAAVELFRKHKETADPTYKHLLPMLENRTFTPLDYAQF